jgi:hypothetical protein
VTRTAAWALRLGAVGYGYKMATVQLYNQFWLKVCQKKICLDTKANGGDTFMIALSNTAPNLAHDELADITEIANGHGYTTGGAEMVIASLSQTGGVVTATVTADAEWTSDGSMATFRYGVVYDTTVAGDPLCWVYDHGSAVTLSTASQKFRWKFSTMASGLLTIQEAA